MALTTTQFVIQGAPVDPAFEGNLQELFEHFLERMRIVAPFGISTFITGTQIPTSNQGPLLLTTATGTGWWVWDDNAKTYVPQDLTDALANNYEFSITEPTNPDVIFWIQTDAQARVINYWIRRGGVWFSPTGARGSTADRPALPADYTRYWDTDINAELIYERGAWRTVSGVPGDIKFVGALTKTEAVAKNPGWREISESSFGPATRGRAFVPAHKDPGATPVTDNPIVAGVSDSRYAGESFGEENIILTNVQTPSHPETHYHGTGAFREDINDDLGMLQRKEPVDEGGFVADRAYKVRRCDGEGATGSATFQPDLAKDDTAPALRATVTTGPLQAKDSYDPPAVDPHANIGPRMALWCLIKE